MTLTIIVAIVAFLAVTLVLVGLLLYAKAKLTSSGDVTIDINDGEKVLTTESGSTLLVTLANNNVFLPSACGGGGSCGMCKSKAAATSCRPKRASFRAKWPRIIGVWGVRSR